MDKKLFYLSNRFSLQVRADEYKTHIDMNLFISNVNTRDFPHTVDFLKKNFPSVLRTQCFNYQNLAFKKEVEETEIGHLFEHILLDQLCVEKMNSGSTRVSYSGRTSWNWKKDKRGVFHILVNASKKETYLLNPALSNTINLIERLLINRNENYLLKKEVSVNNNLIDKFISTGNVEVLPVDLG